MACGLVPFLLVALLVPSAPALRLAAGGSAPFADRTPSVHPDLPWLRWAWLPPEHAVGRPGPEREAGLELLELRGDSDGDEPGRKPGPGPVFQNVHGYYTGVKFLIAALTQGLPLDEGPMLDLANCSVAVHGGGKDNIRPDHPNASVWIVINGEETTGEQMWNRYRQALRPGDKVLVLGNWWNATHESYQDDQVVSLWVPFASTSFGERRYHTPLDLVFRRNRTRFGGGRRLVAYQQHRCKKGRDEFWDQLNAALRSHKPRLRGTSLSHCNGRANSGELLELPKDGGYKHGWRYDWSVGHYEQFRFAWVSEHGINAPGYVTEKIVDAYLAGAVPVYAGLAPEQLRQIFDPKSLIQVFWDSESNAEGISRLLKATEDQAAYDALLRPDEPLVSPDAMRRFFSWHPATWELYGDGLRQTILQKALALCRGAP